MEKSKKSIQYYIRLLHRDIGFILVGLTIIYALSGILLMYRSTGFLQNETTATQEVDKGLEAGQLGKALGMRHFQLERQSGETIFFQGGTYDKATGIATYTKQEFPAVLNMMTQVHKLNSRTPLHVMAVVYAALLFFLAVSSLMMYRPGTRLFRRGLTLSAGGMAMAVVLMFVCAG
jgi:hypothetical protein